MQRVNYRDISFIVQGGVVGSPTDKAEDRHTEICLKSIRRTFPGATIILSTWKGSNVDGLDYDLLVLNDDPGDFIVVDFNPNCGRQIVSTINGLRKCTTKYAVKTRSDLSFTSDGFLKYFSEYNTLPFDEHYKILKERIVTLTTSNPRRRIHLPFTVSDWFYFGLTEDLINIFDIPLVKKAAERRDRSGATRTVDSLLSGEQYIWFTFLSKYKTISFAYTDDTSHDNIVTAEKYMANNCILLPATMAGIDWVRYSRAAYAQRPALSNTGLYTFTDYRRMLNKYANNHLVIIPNPFEELTYWFVYNARFYIEKKSPKLWNTIRRLVNRKTHQKEDELAAKAKDRKR